MKVEMSLEESLMNAITHGRIRGIQFKRAWSNDKATFDDLRAVIGRNIDSAKDVARSNGMNEVMRERRQISDTAITSTVHAICAWLRDGCDAEPLSAPLIHAIANAIENGAWKK